MCDMRPRRVGWLRVGMVAHMEHAYGARRGIHLRHAVRKQSTATGRDTDTNTNPHTETEIPTMTTDQSPRRDYRMYLGGTDELVRDLEYMCADNTTDAIHDIRDMVRATIDRYRAAVKLAADTRHDHITAADELRRVERDAHDEMWQMFAGGKRPAIDATITRIAKLTDDRQRQHHRYQFAAHIERHATAELSRVVRATGHTDDRPVVAWVAWHRARNADAAAMCGDALPLPVLRMWWRCGVLFDQPNPYGLDLTPWETNGRIMRLPIEWPATLDAKHRASLSWWWQQIAAGRYTITDRGRLIVTATLLGALPSVPPTATAATVNTRRRR